MDTIEEERGHHFAAAVVSFLEHFVIIRIILKIQLGEEQFVHGLKMVSLFLGDERVFADMEVDIELDRIIDLSHTPVGEIKIFVLERI